MSKIIDGRFSDKVMIITGAAGGIGKAVALRAAKEGAKQLETLKDSKVALEKIIGKPVDFVAYPFGRYNSSTRVAAEKAGYKLGFNLNGNFTDRKDNNFNMDRIYVSNNDSLQKFESRLTGR